VEHFSIIMGLIGVMYAAVIGVYVWTFKLSQNTSKQMTESQERTARQLGEMYNTINNHLQHSSIHMEKNEFVSFGVCKVVHDSLNEKLLEINTNVKAILAAG